MRRSGAAGVVTVDANGDYNDHMLGTRRVGVREAKANLSALLRAVADGSEVVITDHDRPVARLVGLDPESADVDEQLAIAERLGLVGPPAEPGVLPPLIRIDPGWAQRTLQADRNERG